MWDMLSASLPFLISLAAYLVLAYLVVLCIFAISINDNRLDEMRFVEQQMQQNAQKIASFGRVAVSPEFSGNHPERGKDFSKILQQADDLTDKFWALSYARIYGDQGVRDKVRDREKAREPEHANEPETMKEPARKQSSPWFVDRFHANSDTTNVMIIGLSACSIAFCATKLLGATRMPDPQLMKVFLSVTIFDVALGILTGLLTTFVVKSGSSALSSTSLGAVDVSNPYGVAFVAAVVGLFMDRFYSWLTPASTAMR
jgi:hypothetical protein